MNNARVPTLIVIAETHTEISGDGFSESETNQRRALKLVDGIYVVEVWREGTNGWYLVETVVPLGETGAPMTFIPFEIVDRKLARPPMLDLVDVNLSHYRTCADLEHGAHFTGLPTPVISGYHKADPDEVFRIGSTSAWVFSNSEAKASYLEFSGQGLTPLRDLKNDKEAQMAQLGARMLTPIKAAAESGKALDIRATGETSMLGTVALTMSKALTRALVWATTWAGAGDKASVALNSDLVASRMDAQTLTALLAAWQQGAISHETLFDNLKQGEFVGDTKTFEDESTLIAAEGPTLASLAPVSMAKA